MFEILVATKNVDKVTEFKKILKDTSYKIVFPKIEDIPEVEENEDTYEANALLKAQSLAKISHMPCIADDSGLEVDVLNNEPGVFSGRWAGVSGVNRYKANNQKLLTSLKDIPAEKRTARFISAIVLADARETFIKVRGVCEGRIIFAPRGENGFGYDPLFEVPEYGKTFAELTSEEKNKISHRGRALQKFKEAIEKLKL